MIAVAGPAKPAPFTQALHDWAFHTDSRELYDLVAFGGVAIPLGFLGGPTWWLLAMPPLGLSALGGWALLSRNHGPRASMGVRLAQRLLATVVFLAAVISLLATFFVLMSPPPTL